MKYRSLIFVVQMRSFKLNIEGSDPSENLIYDITFHNIHSNILTTSGQLYDRSGTGICSQIKQETLTASANKGSG